MRPPRKWPQGAGTTGQETGDSIVTLKMLLLAFSAEADMHEIGGRIFRPLRMLPEDVIRRLGAGAYGMPARAS